MKYIKLTGKYSHLSAIVDDEWFEMLSEVSWVFRNGYAGCFTGTTGEYKAEMMHNVILDRHSNLTDIYVTDHINGNPLDNRVENLRVVSRGVNIVNTQKRRNKKYSEYIGVSFYKNNYNKCWRAYIGKNGRRVYDEWFETESEAVEARRLIFNKMYPELEYKSK